MKTGEYSIEFERDMINRFGEHADLHPAVEEFFAMLGRCDSGCDKAAKMVDVLVTGTSVAHFLLPGKTPPLMLVVTFKENETRRLFLRLHAVALADESAA